MINIRKITAIVLAVSLITTTALASVLGSETYSATEIEVASGTTYINNVFVSDQSGVGKQTENYYVYKPNSGVVPVIVNDSYIFGKTTVSSMMKKIQAQGMYPLMVMNSDFFSFKTGVPMGHQVVDGIVMSKDSEGEDAIGIREDGTAFMSWLGISTTITINSQTMVNVENINKYPQPYAIYMLTDKFSTTTQHETPNYNVIIGSVSGEMRLNEEVTGVVEQIVEADGPIEIPQGKIVLTVDNNVPGEKMNMMKQFKVGDQVTVLNSAQGDDRWTDCKYIQGSIGGRLIKDGEIQDIDEAAAPRSAVGITSDGSIIFYTIDGRQQGHSYGVRLKTLAGRLKELGCVDAINFDGGGSTCIAGVYPGTSSGNVLNSPSDGSERSVATFFALMNTRQPSGEPARLHLSPAGGNYLSGATEHFSVRATDTNDHPVDISSEITYSSEGSTYTSTDGTARIIGNGKVSVTASGGGISGSAYMTVFSTPDSINVYDPSGNAVKSLNVNGGESVQLRAVSTVGSKELISDSGCYTWSAEGGIGDISSDGLFTATKAVASGNILVTAGNKTVSLPVSVEGDRYAGVTKMEFSHDSDAIRVKLVNLEGITVEKENISVSLDGAKTNFDYDGENVTVPVSDDMEKKLTVAVTNSAGERTIRIYTATGKEYDNYFVDTTSHWSRSVIAYMSNRGIVNGFKNSNGTFSFNPDKNMTRAEFAVMTANYMGIDPDDYNVLTVPFADAAQLPDWASVQIKTLYTMGIMNGKTYGDGTVRFDSTANVTRAEVVTVLTRILGESLDNQQMNYVDIGDVPAYAIDGFSTMVSMGVLSGYDDGTLKPNKNITRAEAVKLIYGIY
ncbi:MAG: phosphodiester glycosidase family protein [Clostridia bacterium]|nr:phosphodiester glycosidase family protein [Clostridia bacterium]